MNVIYSSGFKRENMSMHVHGIFKKSVVVTSIGNTTTDLISEYAFLQIAFY